MVAVVFVVIVLTHGVAFIIQAFKITFNFLSSHIGVLTRTQQTNSESLLMKSSVLSSL